MNTGVRSAARSRLALLIAALALISAGLPLSARAASPDIVISQVYGGGGNSGATLKNDFIELFNRGDTAVGVTGWSVQYASFGGSSWARTNLSGVIEPGGYYLVQEAQGAGGTTELPTPDATGTIPMSGTSGKVALVTNQIALACGATPGSCLPNPNIRDFVGYGTANNHEGPGPTGTLSNTTAALRASGGCTDTDNNAADFATGSPNPRNSSAPRNPCEGDPVVADCGEDLTTEEGTAATTTVGASDADGTVTGISITSVTPSPSPGTITITELTPAPGPGGTASATVTVDDAVPAGAYTVAVSATNNDANPQTGTCSLNVIVTSPPVAIYEIQGDGSTSPMAGTRRTSSGVVTVILSGGFFMQDATGDGNADTSDGIFVFTGSSLARTLAPGDEVTVTGDVVEFRPGTRPRDLTLTELTSVTVSKTGTTAVPSPVEISNRPDILIDPDGIETYERLEGMLVAVDSPRVIAPTNSFGELVTVASGDVASTTPSGNLNVRDLGGGNVDYNPERIMVDDEARAPGGTGSGIRINNPQANVKTGDQATGDITGALDYQFGNYRVQANHRVDDVLPANTAPTGGDDLREPSPYEGRIATFNVENLFDCVNTPGKDDTASCNAAALAALERQVSKLARAFEEELGSPEITIIEETENTEVLTGDAGGNIPGTPVPALLPRLEGNWDAVSFDASDVRGIEVGFVFNTDRVTLNDAFLSTDVLPDVEGVFDGSVFRAGREPLVGLFTLDDVDLILIGNHFKSKGGPQFGVEPGGEAGDDPLYGAFQPPVRWTEEIRHKQADYVRELVDLLLAESPGANLAVGGDLNDFPFAEPNEGLDTVARIKQSLAHPLANVIDLVPEEDRYTFLFEGNSQVLDHILLNGKMGSLLRHQDIAHINADFPDSFGSDPSIALRASDHDPVVSYYCTDATAPSLDVSASPNVLWPPNHKYVRVEATVSAGDDRDPSPDVALVSVTSNEPDDAPGMADGNTINDILIVDKDTVRLRAERNEAGTGRVYTITYRATDACGNETTDAATVTVPIMR